MNPGSATTVREDPAASPSAQNGRQRILDCAAGLFLRQGYATTSLRDIAAGAGMKAGSLYYHFDSKEDLLGAILRRGMAVMVDAFESTAELTRDEPARQRVEAHVRAHLGTLFEHGPYTAAHVITFPLAPDSVREEIVPLRDGYEALWAQLLAELQDAGAVAEDVELNLARLVLFGAMNATIEWFDAELSSLDDLAGVIVRQFWSGVSTGEERER